MLLKNTSYLKKYKKAVKKIYICVKHCSGGRLGVKEGQGPIYTYYTNKLSQHYEKEDVEMFKAIVKVRLCTCLQGRPFLRTFIKVYCPVDAGADVE